MSNIASFYDNLTRISIDPNKTESKQLWSGVYIMAAHCPETGKQIDQICKIGHSTEVRGRVTNLNGSVGNEKTYGGYTWTLYGFLSMPQSTRPEREVVETKAHKQFGDRLMKIQQTREIFAVDCEVVARSLVEWFTELVYVRVQPKTSDPQEAYDLEYGMDNFNVDFDLIYDEDRVIPELLDLCKQAQAAFGKERVPGADMYNYNRVLIPRWNALVSDLQPSPGVTMRRFGFGA